MQLSLKALISISGLTTTTKKIKQDCGLFLAAEWEHQAGCQVWELWSPAKAPGKPWLPLSSHRGLRDSSGCVQQGARSRLWGSENGERLPDSIGTREPWVLPLEANLAATWVAKPLQRRDLDNLKLVCEKPFLDHFTGGRVVFVLLLLCCFLQD